MGAAALFLPWRLLLAMAMLAACGLSAAAEQAPAAAPAASAANVLPPNLPLRRDLSVGSERAGWSPSFTLLALTGAAGAGWIWWRTTRSRRALGGARSEPAAVLRLSSQALTPHASVHAVRWKGEEFLVGCTAQAVTLLSRRGAEGAAGDPP